MKDAVDLLNERIAELESSVLFWQDRAEKIADDKMSLVAENERLRDLLYRWMLTQEDLENVTPELLEETDKAIDALMEKE